jgi:hypothetical protein
MSSSSTSWLQTARDREILAALDLCPMTSMDLLAFSETFAQPFFTLDRVRFTLGRLRRARQVCSWRYATTDEGGGAAPLYWKLTLRGYRTLHESELAVPPTKRYLEEIGDGRHRHQQCLTAYIVKTHVAAQRRGLRIIDSFPENTFRIETPLGPLLPDRRFTIALPSGDKLVNCVEVDNSTETISSSSGRESIEKKMRKYVLDMGARDYNYRVQFIVTRSAERRDHILALAKRLRPPIDFSPFYIVLLNEYLAAADPLLEPLFTSPKNMRVGLLRSIAESLPEPKTTTLAQAPLAC